MTRCLNINKFPYFHAHRATDFNNFRLFYLLSLPRFHCKRIHTRFASLLFSLLSYAIPPFFQKKRKEKKNPLSVPPSHDLLDRLSLSKVFLNVSSWMHWEEGLLSDQLYSILYVVCVCACVCARELTLIYLLKVCELFTSLIGILKYSLDTRHITP